MNYTLSFNEIGELAGWQDVNYELGGCSIQECHLISGEGFGEWEKFGFIRVIDRKKDRYYFNVVDFGSNFEVARDAAEEFSMYGGNFTQKLTQFGSWDMSPLVEEALINA